MPAGVTWSVYLKFATAAALSMFAGSQFVHSFYRPLQDLDSMVEKEKQRLRKTMKEEALS